MKTAIFLISSNDTGLAGVVVSTEFAMAFVIGRTLRRLRLPLDLAITALIARHVPVLTEIKLTYLVPG
jgi:hypothetical protein